MSTRNTMRPVVAYRDPKDDFSKSSSAPPVARSVSGLSTSSTNTSRLVDLVKEQVDMVRSLTNAHMNSTAELERVRKEKEDMELEARRLKQQLAAADGSDGMSNSTRTTSTSSGGSVNITQVPMTQAAPLTAIPEDNGPKHVYEVAREERAVRDPGNRYRSPMTNATQPTVTEVFEDEPMFGASSNIHASIVRDDSIELSHLDTNHFDEWSTQGYPSARHMPYPSHMDPAPMASVSVVNDVDLEEGHRGSMDDYTCGDLTTVMDPVKPQPREDTCSMRVWRSFAWFCTFFIPDGCIMRSGKEAKQAWREKVAIFIIMVLCSIVFVGVFGFIPLLVCQESEIFRWEDIYAESGEALTVIHGVIYDVKDYINRHPGGSDGVRQFLGQDASKLFARPPPADLPSHCINPAKDLEPFSETACDDMTELDELVGLPCHDFATGPNGAWDYLKDYEHGQLAYAPYDLAEDPYMDYIIIHDRVYNVTNYINRIRDADSNKPDKNHENAFLEDKLNGIVVNKLNEDASDVYDSLFGTIDPRYCLDDLYFVGIVDTRHDPVCHGLGIAMFVMLIFVAFILVLQCFCSLLYLARSTRTFTKTDLQNPIVVMVPCYNEGDKELRKTINSVLKTEYPHKNKVLLVIADGIITGKGEPMSTPKTLASILGFRFSKRDRAYKYESIGAMTENAAHVYHGTYKNDGKSLKYVVVVKAGNPMEKGSPRAGNRGKRDSQIMFAGMLNRIHHRRGLCELDTRISGALNELKIPVSKLKYLMAIDADTRVEEESMSHLAYSLNKDDKILALCGETKVDNKATSWVTMIQVFEYYTNHHMKKAFESVFGCVTCLPGCFTMYRIQSEDGRPLISSDNVYRDYSRNDVTSLHEKNLYHLGEDRMLTTLLLQYFPDMRLSFVPEACCWTIVPHTFKILLSQRRRWINSTFHNMFELLKVKTMCGICCFSMKTVVILDLIGTMILPASLLYIGYFIYIVFVKGESISTLIIILYGIIVGVQVVVFVLRSRWDYFLWFLVFAVLGVPVFYFVLPLYAFWHMDDFSWGSTRRVDKAKEPAKPTPKEMPPPSPTGMNIVGKSGTPSKHKSKSNVSRINAEVERTNSKVSFAKGDEDLQSRTSTNITRQSRTSSDRASSNTDITDNRGTRNLSNVTDTRGSRKETVRQSAVTEKASNRSSTRRPGDRSERKKRAQADAIRKVVQQADTSSNAEEDRYEI